MERRAGHSPVPRQWPAKVGSALFASAGVFLTLAFLTFTPADSAFFSFPPNSPPGNLGGALGAWLAAIGRGGFGLAAYLLGALCWLWAAALWQGRGEPMHKVSMTLGALCLLASAATLLALIGPQGEAQAHRGGMVGLLLAQAGAYYLGAVGTMLTASCVALIAWVVVSGHGAGWGIWRRIWGALAQGLRRPEPSPSASPAPRLSSDASRLRARQPQRERDREPREDPQPLTRALDSPRARIRSTVEPTSNAIPIPPRRQAPGGFQLPPHQLLTNPPPVAERQINEDVARNARILEETLREFGIEATVVNIDRGPTVTRYELTPAPGVKLTKIVSLSDDIALVMKAASCHVVAPIPGKGTVGVDVPNTKTTTVYLKEIIGAQEFAGNPSPIALPIGQDVSGHALVTDLRECPHLLIAGATGSGKTVCLNSLLLGMLTRASPEQVRFLMIDPKMVELAMFNSIPHLIAPVVTNAKKASVALHWAVDEMERRYQLLAKAGVRNIDMYNKKRVTGTGAPPPSPQPAEPSAGEDEGPVDDGRPLPYLVIVVDELADLMMIAAQDVEGAITRLAQLSRAVGLHMILATQRPSVDVITGVIKANFPARIAFQVASKVDSRTILDANGADKLLGRGDLLFLKPGSAKPVRAQGAFVTDAEIEQITSFLKQQGAPAYDVRLMERERQPEGSGPMGEKDELYEQAKSLVLDTGQASTSLLQRRLRLGYGRAARILDLMEQEGLVGPPQGSRPREVLVTREALKQSAGTPNE
ncbi:MAG: DNA translocase FtsK 4TM domain-containing protein [Candidatus Omnitrophica bacterium]|nr:DNA translocase FtsK 4TM domain-containing protein [Candidatus Omnitrophota bacterium]